MADGIIVKGTKVALSGLIDGLVLNSGIDFTVTLEAQLGLDHPRVTVMLSDKLNDFQYQLEIDKRFSLFINDTEYKFVIDKYRTSEDKVFVYGSVDNRDYLNLYRQDSYQIMTSGQVLSELNDPEIVGIRSLQVPPNSESIQTEDYQTWLRPNQTDYQFLSDVFLHSYMDSENQGIHDFLLYYIDLTGALKYGSYARIMYATEDEHPNIEIGNDEGEMRYQDLSSESVPFKFNNPIKHKMGTATYWGSSDDIANKWKDENQTHMELDCGNTYQLISGIVKPMSYQGAPTHNMNQILKLYRKVYSFSINKLWDNNILPLLTRLTVMSLIGPSTESTSREILTKTFIIVGWSLKITNRSIGTEIHMARIDEANK